MKTEWGCTIVDRMPKGLTFTAEGNFLAAQAEKYLELFHDTKEELKKLQDAALTEIVIAGPFFVVGTDGENFRRSALPTLTANTLSQMFLFRTRSRIQI